MAGGLKSLVLSSGISDYDATSLSLSCTFPLSLIEAVGGWVGGGGVVK